MSFVRAVLVLLVACGPVKGTPPDDGPPTDTPSDPGFEITLLAANVNVPLDGKVALELAITRTGGFTGEIEIAADTPPTGLTVEPLTIPGDATTAEVVVGALAPLAIGDTLDFELVATAGELDQELSIEDAEITGRPGSLDIAFGAGTGYGSIGFGSDDGGSFNALDVLNGHIIATGIGLGGLGGTRFSTMRFTPTGVIDATFNNGTRLVTAFSGSSSENTVSAAIGHQIDGRPILIGSHQAASPTQDIAIARLSVNGGSGGVDFGNQLNAKTLIDLSGATDNVNDGLVLADNRIVTVGTANGHHAVAIVQSNGSGLDGTFNTTGFFRDVLGNASIAQAVAVDADSRLVVLGLTRTDNGVDLTLHRYGAVGLDTTFGTGGRVTVAVPNSDELPIGIAALPSGKILVAALAQSNYQLRQFNADGTPDTTFGTDGVAVTPSGGAAPRKLLVLPDGKILLLAKSGNNAVLVRFKSTGAIDPLFAPDGTGTLEVPFGDDAEVNAVIVYDRHKIVIAGGNVGAIPGPGTKGLLARVWM